MDTDNLSAFDTRETQRDLAAVACHLLYPPAGLRLNIGSDQKTAARFASSWKMNSRSYDQLDAVATSEDDQSSPSRHITRPVRSGLYHLNSRFTVDWDCARHSGLECSPALPTLPRRGWDTVSSKEPPKVFPLTPVASQLDTLGDVADSTEETLRSPLQDGWLGKRTWDGIQAADKTSVRALRRKNMSHVQRTKDLALYRPLVLRQRLDVVHPEAVLVRRAIIGRLRRSAG